MFWFFFYEYEVEWNLIVRYNICIENGWNNVDCTKMASILPLSEKWEWNLSKTWQETSGLVWYQR